MLKYLIFSFFILLQGCSSSADKKITYAYKIIDVIPSQKNGYNIVVIKTGVDSGATVPFEYQFFVSKNKKELYRRNMFLWVRDLKNYHISWLTEDTFNVTVNAKLVMDFHSRPYAKENNDLHFFFVNKFLFQVKEI